MPGDDHVGQGCQVLDRSAGEVHIGRVEVAAAVEPEVARHCGVGRDQDGPALAVEAQTVVVERVTGCVQDVGRVEDPLADTAATGNVGRGMIPRLRAAGHELVLSDLNRAPDAEPFAGLPFVQCDVQAGFGLE